MTFRNYPTRVKFGSRSICQTINERGENVLVIEVVNDLNTGDMFGAWQVDNISEDVRGALQMVIDEYRRKYGLQERTSLK